MEPKVRIVLDNIPAVGGDALFISRSGNRGVQMGFDPRGANLGVRSADGLLDPDFSRLRAAFRSRSPTAPSGAVMRTRLGRRVTEMAGAREFEEPPIIGAGRHRRALATCVHGFPSDEGPHLEPLRTRPSMSSSRDPSPPKYRFPIHASHDAAKCMFAPTWWSRSHQRRSRWWGRMDPTQHPRRRYRRRRSQRSRSWMRVSLRRRRAFRRRHAAMPHQQRDQFHYSKVLISETASRAGRR